GVFSLGQRVADVVAIVAVKAFVWFVYVGQWSENDTILAGVTVASFVLVAEANGIYRSWRGAMLRDELRSLLWTWLLTGPFLLLWLFATKTSEDYSRVATFSWFISTGLILAVMRSAKATLLGFFRAN